MKLSVCNIGPERPVNLVQGGLYVGDCPTWRGKTSLISPCEGGWIVQVDDTTNPYAYGWWKFPFDAWMATD